MASAIEGEKESPAGAPHRQAEVGSGMGQTRKMGVWRWARRESEDSPQAPA